MPANTTILKCKCMACSLHYVIYTNFPDQWIGQFNKETEQRSVGRQPFCPECGTQNTWVLRTEESEQFIFQFVSA